MFNFLLNALLTSWLLAIVFTQSDIFCSKNETPWVDAMNECLDVYGKAMSFHGDTGLSIENINLRPDVTVWTADYLKPGGSNRKSCLCSFRHYTKETFYKESDELFSCCDDFRYMFCKNNNVIEVLNNTRAYAYNCGSFAPTYQLQRILKPGYYWIGNTSVCGSDGLATIETHNLWQQTQNSLCGAYSKDAGRHFRRCDTGLRHVCVSCTDPSVSVSHTHSSNLPTTAYVNVTVSMTELPQTSTRTTQDSSESHIINSTFRNAKGSAHEQGGPNTGTDSGLIAGIVVGVCLAGGIVLFIFIYRRNRCLFNKNTTSNTKPKTNNGTSNRPKKSKAHTLFNNIGYDTWDDNQKQNNTKQSKRNNTEISNNGMSSIDQHRTAEDGGEPYYNQTNSTHGTDITDQQTTDASSYSFSLETDTNVGENEMSPDEYDTTISPRKGVYKTENLYNKLEPVNSSSDVYDSTLRQGQTLKTDDVYNKLSCNTKYGKFGTTLSDNEDYDSVGNTLKSHNTQQCTDNVYN